MFCNQCGNNVPNEMRYCPNCGAAMHPAAQEAQPVYTPPIQKEKKSHGGMIALIVILATCLVLLCLLVIGLLAIFGISFSWNKEETIHNGNSVVDSADGALAGNIYQNVYERYPDFVLPGSDSSYKCYRDIDGMTEEELTVAEQEIYARYGKSFSDQDLQEYFEARDWYPDSAESFTPNAYEQANLDLIRVYRAKQDGSLYRSGNKYINAVSSNMDYVFRYSSTQLLTSDEVEDFSEEQLCVARNEILARRGWIFDHEQLREYFYSKAWYVPSIPGGEFDYSSLSDTEQSNMTLILFYEEHEGSYVQWSADNPYKEVFDKYRYQNYIFANSNSRRLQKSDLDGMTEYELTIARNEIYARNGYTFKSHNLMEYFQHHSWYAPTAPVGSSVSFNAVEQDNINLIQEAEKEASKDPNLIYHYNSGTTDLGSLDTMLGYSGSCNMFTVKLPNYWKQYAKVETSDKGIYFYEKLSNEAGCGGFLFSLWICEEEDEYDYLPSFEHLGMITSPDGKTYHLIVSGPTDVQFAMENMELHNKMQGEEDRIIATITGNNGWSYTPD